MRQVLVIVFAGFLANSAAAQDSAVAAAPVAETVAETVAGPVSGASAPDTPATLDVLDATEVSLEDFLWIKRPIVVFADSPADPRFDEQIKLLLERPEELLARDVVLIADSNPAARSELRTKLRPRGFMLTLIGKDGRVNLRKPAPWDIREVTHAIDKWPLRLQEIRDAKEKAAAEQ